MTYTIDPAFNPLPSLSHTAKVRVAEDAAEGAIVKFVGKNDAELTDQLRAAGFEGKRKQTFIVPGEQLTVLVGAGESGIKTKEHIRDAVAYAVRALKKEPVFTIDLRSAIGGCCCTKRIAQAAVEGAVLARYRYEILKEKQENVQIQELVLLADAADHADAQEGAERGLVLARTAEISRDLGNTPPRHLTAVKYADVVAEIAPQYGLKATVFEHDEITELGLGGLLGVNAGSVTDPRVVKLEYKPENATGHVALVGKGITYDSGGISLKPSNPSHCSMKMDMMGSSAVFGAMTALQALNVTTAVTGFLMLTDNMPSGSATKLGDVLTMRNGTTVEIHNTDAEGRLVLGDGLALATELEPTPDAIIDVATLTGAALVALGEETTALIGNHDGVIAQLEDAADASGDPVWELPLDFRLKKTLDSKIADMKNIGGQYAGTITAALYLHAFVNDLPWGHLDIAGPMEVSSDDAWRSAGSTGVGARLLAEFLRKFEKPEGDVKKADD